MTIRSQVKSGIGITTLIMVCGVSGSWVMAQSSELAPEESTLNTRVEQLEKIVATFPRLTLTDFGCVPNDAAVDNGPAITRLLDAQGRDFVGELIVPALTYYVSTTIDTPAKTGGNLRGAGGAGSLLIDSVYTKQTKGGGAVSRLVWTGKAGGTILRYRSVGMNLDNVMMQGRRVYDNSDRFVGPRAAVGIEVVPAAFPPCGKLAARRVTVAACDVGVYVSPGPDHADAMTWDQCTFAGCGTAYRVAADHSVCHYFRGLRVPGPGCTVFDFQYGGELHADDVIMGNGTLLKLGRPDRNGNWFEIEHLSVDAQAQKGFCPLVMDAPEWANVTITGFMDPSAKALPPVVPDSPDGRRPNVTIQITNYPFNMTRGVADRSEGKK